jgi:outer membrane immunogenic protein
MRKALLAAAVLFSVGGAHAADLAYKAAPVMAPVPTWTGWYIGVNGGGTWNSISTNAADIGPDGFFAVANRAAVVAGATQSFNGSGGLAGGQVGYLFQTGRAIWGVEAGFDWSGLRASTSNGPTPYPVTPGSTFAWNLQAKQDWLFTFLGRVGYDAGSWYPYLTGGLAVTHESYSANFLDTFYPTNNTFTFGNTTAGGVLGAGAEFRVSDHWLLRGEYLYMEFDGLGGNGLISCNSPGVGNCAAGGNTVGFSFGTSKFRDNVGRLALSYKF